VVDGLSATTLFDGATLEGWRFVGDGAFAVVGRALEAQPGSDLGLLWSTTPTPVNFELSCEWRASSADDNSGVFVRFPDPDSKGYSNGAYVAVDLGFEVQIDDKGAPDGADAHRTGAIYGEPNQAFTLQAALPVGRWNSYLIRVSGQSYVVELNGVQVTRFDNPDPNRGAPSTPGAPSFVGVQANIGNVAFRHVVLRAIRGGG
jgi:hypothetical protein